MNNFNLQYLADRPECIQACAAWAFGRWGVQQQKGSLEFALQIFEQGAQKGRIPLTVVMINQATDLPVAMGSLWESDGTDWPDKSPWIASVYTLYRYRRQGLAARIIERLEQEAARLGFSTVYLHSGSAADYYRKLGYTELDRIPTQTTAAGTRTLFRKEVNAKD